MFKTNQQKETMTKYEVRTFGVKNNYTCVLYKFLKHEQLEEIKSYLHLRTLVSKKLNRVL